MIVLVAACSRGAGDVIVVGEFNSMSGSEATFGQLTHNGVKLAVDEQNAAGGVLGKKLVLRSYDDQGRAQEAGTAVTRLITEDHAVAVIGETASGVSIAGGRIAQRYGVPLISPSSTHPSVTQVGDMVFRVCFIDSFQGGVIAHFARDRLKLGKVGILYDQAQAYSIGLRDDFKRIFAGLGGTVPLEQAYTGGDQDFSAQLVTLRGADLDAVFVPGYYTDAGNILVQAKKLGLKVPFLGGDGWESPQLAAIAGEAAEGSYFSAHFAPEDERPETQAFVKRYEKVYGYAPDSNSALGYDAVQLLLDGLRRAGTTDGKALARALAATKDLHGATGVFSIDAQRNPKKAAVILQMKGGKPVYVMSINP
jgi:branched-chain amino acid transport system substrate-binding protein